MATPSLQLPDVEIDVRRRTCSAGRTRSSATALCLTCSWQKQSSVLVHMVAELGLRHRRRSSSTRTSSSARATRRATASSSATGSTLIQPPAIIDRRRAAPRGGPNLWERDPDRCCHIRKVEPLLKALEPYDAWISGIRRDQSPSRADTPKVEWSERYERLEAAPARRLGREARLGLHPRQRDSVQPAARRRLPLDRLHPVHPSDGARRGGARRPLGRLRQARVRHPRRTRSEGDA